MFRVNTQDRPALEDATDYWQEDTSEGTYPQRRYRASHDIMSPAVAYYLTMCLPERDHMIHRNEGLLHRSLYVHMCWVVLEVTCLLCEYWRGSLDMENHERRQQKRYQCHKSPLGAAELYFSYFCWRVLGFEHAGVGVMSFVHFHQLYMWSAAGCEALFPHRESDASGGLLADLICPSTTDAPSRPLIEAVASKMVGVFQRIRPLGLHLSGRGNTRLARYFLPPKYIPELTLLARGSVPVLLVCPLVLHR